MAKIGKIFERIERMWRRYTHDLVEEKIEDRIKDICTAHKNTLNSIREAHAKEISDILNELKNLRIENKSLKETSDKHKWCILDIRPEYELRYPSPPQSVPEV